MKPLTDRWLAAKRALRQSQLPAGRYLDDVWFSFTEIKE